MVDGMKNCDVFSQQAMDPQWSMAEFGTILRAETTNLIGASLSVCLKLLRASRQNVVIANTLW